MTITINNNVYTKDDAAFNFVYDGASFIITIPESAYSNIDGLQEVVVSIVTKLDGQVVFAAPITSIDAETIPSFVPTTKVIASTLTTPAKAITPKVTNSTFKIDSVITEGEYSLTHNTTSFIPNRTAITLDYGHTGRDLTNSSLYNFKLVLNGVTYGNGDSSVTITHNGTEVVLTVPDPL